MDKRNSITTEEILNALKGVKDPDLNRDIVSLGFIKDIVIAGQRVDFTLELTTPACPLKEKLQEESRAAVLALPDISEVNIKLTSQVKSKNIFNKKTIPGVKNIIVIASGKGGVGKSTVSVNIAFSLAQSGAKVGLLDTDIYGPSIPMMSGVNHKLLVQENLIIPAEKNRVKMVSMGFLADENTPVIWRGPMVHKIIKQFLGQIKWGDLDYLIMDLPPGTGDVQLTLTQLAPISGAVIVTTPQNVALLDAKKGLMMFKKVNVPILGIIENMSYFTCSHCGEKENIFSQGGGRQLSEEMKISFLGEIPIYPAIRECSDKGIPIIEDQPDSPAANAYKKITGNLVAEMSKIVNLTPET